MIIIGHWSAQPQGDHVFMLANPTLDRLTIGESVGGELFALKQFPKIHESLEDVRVMSSAALPDAAFTERYINSDLYVESPGLLTTLGYDAARMASEAVKNAVDRAAVTTALKQMRFSGLNGVIEFEHGYWVDAPIIEYRYNDDGLLTLVK
jgi:ABC-type branched-subunit amino acid transport system substrate-binding protein